MSSRLLALAAVIPLAACNGSGSPTAFAHRPRLPACGVVDRATLPARLSVADRAMLRCFEAAVAHTRPAEMTVLHLPETDGTDDVYLRVLGADHVEEFWHAYGFRYGGNGWTRRECTSFTSTLTATGLLFPRNGPECVEMPM
jgi:hypothetical protein